MYDFFIDDSDPVNIQKSLFDRLAQFHLKPLDILVTVVGDFGKTALVFSDDCPAIFSCKSSLMRNVKINPFYLTAYFSCRYGYALIRRGQRGAVQPGINLFDLRNIPVPIVSDDFQDKIEQLVLEAREVKKDSATKYLQAERLLLSELGLQNWRPAHTLTYARNYTQVEQARRMDAEFFQPKYGELREKIRNYLHGYLKITDIATNSEETIEPRAHPEQKFNYIELASINQIIGTIEGAKEIKGKDAPSRARMLLHKDDVIASRLEGSLGKVALLSEEYQGAVGSTGFFVLRPRTVESGYLLALTKSVIVEEQMRCEASGTILAAVSAKSLCNIIIPNISPDKRGSIAELVKLAHAARRDAKAILEKAKRAVEIAIEENEERAIKFIGC